MSKSPDRPASSAGLNLSLLNVHLTGQILAGVPGITTLQSDFDGGRDVWKRALSRAEGVVVALRELKWPFRLSSSSDL